MANREIRAIVRGIERLSERAVTKITLDLTANLVETTPVDLGWARANWVPSVGVPFEQNLSNVKPTPEAASATAARRDGTLANLSFSYRLRQGPVFVTNNVPYILRLNFGSSRQAPAGFVQRAVAKAVTVDIAGRF